MLNQDIIKKLNFKHPGPWLATWFGCGLIRYAPGTIGTIGAMPLAVMLYFLGGTLYVMIGAAVIFLVGMWASDIFEKQTKTHDNGAIVIDEAAGVLLTVAAVPEFNLVYFGLAFALFRLFDILKPWPVSWFDKKPGAWGVMMDDVAAGIMAAGVLYLIHLNAAILL